MRRLMCVLVGALALVASPSAYYAGTATVTTTAPGCSPSSPLPSSFSCNGGIVQYSIAWTSTAGGAVSGNAFSTIGGQLLHVEFVPNTSGTQPTDLYDITLVNSHSVDLLNGQGANLSNSTSLVASWDPVLYLPSTETLDLVVANAGNAKTGTVNVWMRVLR